ncbi:hypothetical protein [Roseomonas rosulenta]|uniref:hypothetical protein n=1 Tax=Roseomonas rosulenta TaxID=2748667 RepID=UPI0018DFFED4|nr:hypothetical protein [Roseomonas rosulenta]
MTAAKPGSRRTTCPPFCTKKPLLPASCGAGIARLCRSIAAAGRNAGVGASNPKEGQAAGTGNRIKKNERDNTGASLTWFEAVAWIATDGQCADDRGAAEGLMNLRNAPTRHPGAAFSCLVGANRKPNALLSDSPTATTFFGPKVGG